MNKFFVALISVLVVAASSAVSVYASEIPVTVRVSYDGSLVFSSEISLTESSITAILDSDGTSHDILSDSALAALKLADEQSADFSVSQLMYFPAWDALYINCIDIADPAEHACAEWMYEVNRQSPPVGMDNYDLASGDVLDVYFGSIAPVPAPEPILHQGRGPVPMPKIVEIIDIMPVSTAEPAYQSAPEPQPAIEEPEPEPLPEIIVIMDIYEELKSAPSGASSLVEETIVEIPEEESVDRTVDMTQTANVATAIDPSVSWWKSLMGKISSLFNSKE